jgi:hypothetical protein
MKLEYLYRANVKGLRDLTFTMESMTKIAWELVTKTHFLFSEPAIKPLNANKIIGTMDPEKTFFDKETGRIFVDVDFQGEFKTTLATLMAEQVAQIGLKFEGVIFLINTPPIKDGHIHPDNIRKVHSFHLIQDAFD